MTKKQGVLFVCFVCVVCVSDGRRESAALESEMLQFAGMCARGSEDKPLLRKSNHLGYPEVNLVTFPGLVYSTMVCRQVPDICLRI